MDNKAQEKQNNEHIHAKNYGLRDAMFRHDHNEFVNGDDQGDGERQSNKCDQNSFPMGFHLGRRPTNKETKTTIS